MKYSDTTRREKDLADTLKLLKSQLKHRHPEKRPPEEYTDAVFVAYEYKFNEAFQVEELKMLPKRPGNYEHGKIYKVLKDELKKPFWREPTAADYRRNQT